MRRTLLLVFVLALAWGSILALLIHQPGYTDAYYYFNAGQRLAEGKGLTDPYLWVYINAPSHLPGPSHTYWMPLESLIAALSMAVGGSNYGIAQIPSVLCFAGLVTFAYGVGLKLGNSRRQAWIAALLVMFSGFFSPFWTTTDTFALYGLVGGTALFATGRGRETGRWQWYALAGALSAFAHLTRADGLLLLIVTFVVALWSPANLTQKRRLFSAMVAVAAYLLVMLPWFIRNMDAIGTPLPTGGTQTIWLRGYDELVNYPPGASPSKFLDWGIDHIIQSRWDAFLSNLGTFIAVETWIILGPFILWMLWKHRKDPFLLGLILYAAGLHFVMTFVFAYPGYRGGLFHSSSALLPFWAVLGIVGLDEAIVWMARKRRWRRTQAQFVFGTALVVLAVLVSVNILINRISTFNKNGADYKLIAADLPRDAVLMINDPSSLYYHTKLTGVVLPNSDPSVVTTLATRYGVTHLVLDKNRTQPFAALFEGTETRPFLKVYKSYDDFRVFEIVKGAK